MKLIAADSKYKKSKKNKNVAKFIFDDDFINEVLNYIELFDPICKLINTCQDGECSVADAVDLWLNLNLPEKFQEKFEVHLQERKAKAINVYGLAAFYLHPNYNNDSLSKYHKKQINLFFFERTGC